MFLKKCARWIKQTQARKLISVIVLVFVCGLAGIYSILRFSTYAGYRRFMARPVSTRLYDCDGRLIQIVSLEDGLRREYVPLAELPQELAEIFVVSEDRHFYTHRGIHMGAVMRAALQNIHAQRTVSGASTITMQLARIISPRARRTVGTKIVEAWNALRLESRLSKEKLLDAYLNSVPFGFNTEGVATAARTFFGVPVTQLTETQQYCLAVIPRRPAYYNPLTSPDACADAAYELYLSFCDAKNKIAVLSSDDFRVAVRGAHSFHYPFEMPHYVTWLMSQPSGGIYTDAEVHLAASLAVQHRAESLLAQQIEQHRDHRLSNGAVLVTDTRTGAILAWVGSGDFADRTHSGQVDGVLAPVQPGSSMKPFLYALALEHGYSPGTVLPDVPLEFGFDELYMPHNFNNRYNGPVRLRVALASSLNVPAVYLLNELGLDTYHTHLAELHFESLNKNDTGLGLALGNGAVPLYELVQAFSVFPRDGVFIPLSVSEQQRAVTPYGIPVYSHDTARLICDILSDADARALGFGYAQTFITPFPSLFKTGTANQFQTITALGATPLYTVGAWMGNFSGETVIGQTGSSVPARIVRELLVSLQGNRIVDFKTPSQLVRTKICSLSGMPATPYCTGTVWEYMPTSSADGTLFENGRAINTEQCTWHTAREVQYPAEYGMWFRLKSRTGAVVEYGAPLTIMSPRDGSVFFYDASSSALDQKLRIEVIGGTGDILSVHVDDHAAYTVARPFGFQIPLERGTHHVLVRCETEEARISFTVK